MQTHVYQVSYLRPGRRVRIRLHAHPPVLVGDYDSLDEVKALFLKTLDCFQPKLQQLEREMENAEYAIFECNRL